MLILLVRGSKYLPSISSANGAVIVLELEVTALRCPYAGFSSRQLLPLWSTGSRHRGSRSCSLWSPEHGYSSCGTWAWLTQVMWNLLRPGIEPVSPALADRLLSTVPPGKSLNTCLLCTYSSVWGFGVLIFKKGRLQQSSNSGKKMKRAMCGKVIWKCELAITIFVGGNFSPVLLGRWEH